MITLEVKFKSIMNREGADRVIGDTASLETLVMQLEKFSEGEFTDSNEASDCDEKYKDVPEEDAGRKVILKNILVRYFMTLKKQRIKCGKLIHTKNRV